MVGSSPLAKPRPRLNIPHDAAHLQRVLVLLLAPALAAVELGLPLADVAHAALGVDGRVRRRGGDGGGELLGEVCCLLLGGLGGGGGGVDWGRLLLCGGHCRLCLVVINVGCSRKVVDSVELVALVCLL